jgi:uncharacterized protein (DUF1697 family)
MPRYVAFLRGVSPMNLQMSELRACLEKAGFRDVKTVLASGNAAFTSTAGTVSAIERKVEEALLVEAGRHFHTIIRTSDELGRLIAEDPFKRHRLPSDAKPVVTFSRKLAPWGTKLPEERDGARILEVRDREAFTAYRPSPRGPVFMVLIKEAFGDDVTTRTWETVKKCAKA